MGRLLLAASCALLLSGCALNRPSEIRNRFASYEDRTLPSVEPGAIDPDARFRFEASISTNPVPAADKGVAITELSDRAQAAYVEALAARSKDEAGLADAIARPDKAAASAPALYLAKGKVEARIIASIVPVAGLLPPGDRLAWAKLQIVPTGPARFTGWTLAANRQTAITVGSIKATQTDKLAAETGLKIGSPLVDTKISAESSSAREETATITDRTTINARIDERMAELIQLAGWRDDLQGNATFDTTLEISTPLETYIHRLGKLWEKEQPLPGDKVGLARQVLDLPEATPTCATLTLDYVVRHVVAEQASHTESDDVVQFIRGRFTSGPQLLAPVQRTPRWGLEVGSFGPLLVRRNGRDEALAFGSAAEAIDLVAWLAASSGVQAPRGVAFRVREATARSADRPLRRTDFDEMVPYILSGGPPPRGSAEPSCAVRP
ncbi:hypothetical protein [Sphingomonas beigongshangi]|uniref:hypothetical protein n=1 Tax=Sphingomonas beigongshangi TaxID=2782540 RepID=UPI001AEF2D7A|nr:hypothetical protein [Sphingomonas beigongshangi]